ncbi:MAG: hypothetical protein F6K30_30140 [Cyanothece sp. SIO2G6]|nr:hypothetical protein [Cyanothece sp. SIO2G6]
MTPREQLIQEIFQAPDWLIDVLLKVVRLGQTGDSTFNQQLTQIVEQDTPTDSSSLFAYDLAKELAGCVEGGQPIFQRIPTPCKVWCDGDRIAAFLMPIRQKSHNQG